MLSSIRSSRTSPASPSGRGSGSARTLGPLRRALLLPLLLVGIAAGAQERGTPPVHLIPVVGVVEMGLAPFIERSLKEAEAAGAAAVILDIDTPGGRVDSAERIADALQDARVPTYAYINRRAFSAGAMIALAADEIHMRPGAVIGAATPVDGQGEKASEKMVSAMRSTMRSLAEARGLDPLIAEAMVDETLDLPGISEEGRLLTLTTDEAVGIGYAASVADLDELLAGLGLEGHPVTTSEVNWAERIVRFLSHPAVAPFLLSLGFLGLIVEVKTPGLGLAGLAGTIALVLFFGSHLILGLAGWEDILLFVGGGLLLAVEIFFIPGFGVLGALGILGMLGGLYMGMLGGIPTFSDFARAGGVLSSSLLLFLLSSWVLLRRLPNNDRLRRAGVLLDAVTSREAGYTAASRRSDLEGRAGVTLTALRPSGTALIGDERLDVVAERGWVEEGTAVVVVHSEGYRHVVRPWAETVDGDPGSGAKGGSGATPGEGSGIGEGPSPVGAG